LVTPQVLVLPFVVRIHAGKPIPSPVARWNIYDEA
jgi:hypothetical protein